MEDRLTPWTPSGIGGSGRRSHQVHLTCIHIPYHQRQEQPIITVCVCTCKSKNGRDLLRLQHPATHVQEGTTLSVLRLVETAGDRAARTHYKCHVTMTETIVLRKCKSFDCSTAFLRFTRTVSALFSYFMMTLIMIC